MIPHRFTLLGPYLASFVRPRFARPSVFDMLYVLTRPSNEQRAMAYIDDKRVEDDYLKIHFKGFDEAFYYPKNGSWLDLCQTIDEVFNPKNWHHFISDGISLTPEDTIVDCGAAEGLFSFFAAKQVAKVYAIEPIPFWYPALVKTCAQFKNIELKNVGVGHRNAKIRMTNDEIRSHISIDGALEIPIRTLDSLFADEKIPVSFIKADIEGFEFQMLLGAEETIRRNRPKIALTVYHETNHFPEIQEFLRNIHPDYRFIPKGISANGHPTLLQAY